MGACKQLGVTRLGKAASANQAVRSKIYLFKKKKNIKTILKPSDPMGSMNHWLHLAEGAECAEGAEGVMGT